MEAKVIHRAEIKNNTLLALDKALAEISMAIRACTRTDAVNATGRSVVSLENESGFAPHSMELIEETLSDGKASYCVRFLFVGDV